MNAFDLLESIGSARDVYIAAAMEESPRKQRISGRRVVLIALAAALALLLVGCAVAYVLSLRELKIAEEPGIRNFDEAGQWAEPTEVTEAVISLRGYPHSPNYLATKEWYEFEKAYDPEKKLLADEQPAGVSDSHYYAYGCYTKEMADKVDEIAAKYNLKLLSPETVVQRYQMDVMFEALGIDGVCHADRIAKPTSGAGYFYPEGNFKYEFEFLLPQEENAWPYEVWAELLYTRKGYFDPDYMGLDAELYEEWNHTTETGMEVLIAMSGRNILLFAEQEDAFLMVRLDTASMLDPQETRRPTKEDAQRMAEAIDFALQPQIPDMTNMEEKLEKAQQEHDAKQQAAHEKEAAVYTGYGAYIKEKYIDRAKELAGTPYVINYYALHDINGDGIQELMLCREPDYFSELFTMKDGEVWGLRYWSRMHLCEGGYVRQIGINNQTGEITSWSFGKLIDGEFQWIETYGHWDDRWDKSAGDGQYEFISEEEALRAISKYTLLDIEMKPISEFPME